MDPRTIVYDTAAIALQRACFLCRAATLPLDRLPWHDRPLIRARDGAVVVPALGALSGGHVLVAPAQHVPSPRLLPRDSLLAYLPVLTSVVDELEEVAGPVTVFEHGSCFDDHTARSACTEHAHLQVLPGRFDLAAEGSVLTYASLTDFYMGGDGPTSGYLLFQNPGRPVCVAPDPGVSQYVRRLIAARIGEEGDWDYAVFPRLANVATTIELISQRRMPPHA